MPQCLSRRATLIATIVCSARPPCAVRHSGTWFGDLREKLHVQERGMAFKVLKLFSLLWQSFKGGSYSVWIAFLPFFKLKLWYCKQPWRDRKKLSSFFNSAASKHSKSIHRSETTQKKFFFCIPVNQFFHFCFTIVCFNGPTSVNVMAVSCFHPTWRNFCPAKRNF